MIVTKILNFLMYLGIILFVILLGFSVPLVQGLLQCYDSAVENFDDVEASSRSYGWQLERVCDLKATHILTLESCLNTTKSKSILPQKIQEFIILRLPMIRPNSQIIETRKLKHDLECADYPSTLFHLPINK
jgi:hypothetical protein